MKKKKGAKDKGAPQKGDKGDNGEKGGEGEPAAPPPEPDAAAEENPAEEDTKDELQPMSPTQGTASRAQQSKARSASFRQPSISGPLSPGLFSPEGETAPEIYRKHVARIEELEKENKRLAKEAADTEKRWQKAEEELADLRERDGDATGKKVSGSSGEVEKLVSLLITTLLFRFCRQ